MNPKSTELKIRSPFVFLFVVFLFSITETVQGQPLKYENLGFSEALAKAKKSNRLLFMQLESDCNQCNNVADEGLSGKDISAIFEKFICIKVGYNSEDYKKIITDYRIFPYYPSSLFVNSHANYLTSMLNKSTSNRNEYIKLAANAMSSEKNPPFKKYEDALTKEKADKDLLRQYITKLNDSNFNISDLTEKYVGALTIKGIEDTTELKFLIRTAPFVNSSLYKFIHYNSQLYRKVFESIPYEERVRINQKTIARSKEKLFHEKDRAYMYAVSSFLSGAYEKDFKAAQRASSQLQMDFYHIVKDSSMYFRIAKQYYDFNFNKLKMDSVCKAEMNRTFQRPDGAIIKGGVLYKTGNQLNRIAFTLFELSSDKEHLGFALKLSEQTIGYHYPAYIDTYAQILYKLGAKKDAIDWQQKAVNLCDSLHQPNKQYNEVLAKMKDGSL